MKRNANFVVQKIGNEKMLVPLATKVGDMNGIITLNEVGIFIWEMLAKDSTADELISAVTDIFCVDEATARTDVQSFIDNIAQLELIEE